MNPKKETYQFGFVITIGLETEASSEEEAQAWAEEEAQGMLKGIAGREDEGISLMTPLIVHPNHILKLEQILERL